MQQARDLAIVKLSHRVYYDRYRHRFCLFPIVPYCKQRYFKRKNFNSMNIFFFCVCVNKNQRLFHSNCINQIHFL